MDEINDDFRQRESNVWSRFQGHLTPAVLQAAIEYTSLAISFMGF